MKTIEPLFTPKEVEIQHVQGGYDVYLSSKAISNPILPWILGLVFLFVIIPAMINLGIIGLLIFIGIISIIVFDVRKTDGSSRIKSILTLKESYQRAGGKLEIRADGIRIRENFFKMQYINGFSADPDDFSTYRNIISLNRPKAQMAVRYGIYDYATPFAFDKVEITKVLISLNRLVDDMRGSSSRSVLASHQSKKF